MSNISRRKFMLTASATTLGTFLVHGCGSEAPPSATSTTASTSTSSSATPAVNVSAADAPEVKTAKLGFIALSDFAPLAIAKEKGMFAKYGMPDVEVIKQKSWGATRDNLELGAENGGIDGAHILTPMPYLISLGKITKGNKPIPMNILLRLNVNGQGISVANTYKDLKLRLDTSVIKERVMKAKAAGTPMTFAETFPGGTHWGWIRYWLAAGGIDPDNDVKTITVPPPQMVANMKLGNMDGFCVGEPWNLQLVNQDIGYTALTTGEIWNRHPEKSFAMRADFVEKNPKATKALVKAIMEAQMWCDKPENKQEMCQIMSKPDWIKVPVTDIIDRSKGSFKYGDDRPVVDSSPHVMQYWTDGASFPYKSHDKWFLTENIRWGVLSGDTDYKIIDKVNRSDIWKECAKAIGQEAAIPKSDSRGVEKFFDGIEFDPEKPEAYLKSLKIKKV
ncbi:CmpA/NrtA family ABC transporter substrate-binding protein [Tumidithrix elongata RA019]|uniref:CmpA/NrtA family ABC transporter substrate-binding protein n=1 Tax=Tumidithrix elongata BACA0141 TaxID=2716417 RepID=A0AAW9PYD9_9CYAN|nr:CmpA/NrtA family ABC transporter substrate-binding protein [Tumidithrix elongata RA019]